MRVAAIANMRAGLERFVFRELQYFSAAGFSIQLFPTHFGPGLYHPEPDWRVTRWSVPRVLLRQFGWILQRPKLYWRTFKEAWHYKSLVEFLLAWYFARSMQDADVIYATFGDRKLFIGHFCKIILQKPLVVTVHAYELYSNPNPALFVRALQCSDQIITVSDHNLELLRDRYGIPADRIRIVRYGIDLEEHRPERKFVVLIVSFFTYRKGHEILLKAVKQLQREDIEIWVVGDAAGRHGVVDVRAMADQLGMQSQVAFFGALKGTALKAVYHACDVFCLPSRMDETGSYEGFPNVLIEAMACGKPVITTRHAEIPRIVPEIIVDENDVDGLAAAIEQVYLSQPLRARLGRQNRALAEKYFPARNSQQTVEILCRVAQNRVLNQPAQDLTLG